MFHARSTALIAGFAVALAGASAVRAAEPVKIQLPWVAPVSNWGSIWLEKKDLAQNFGKSYVLEPVHFTSSSEMITAIGAGELNIANLAFSSFALAVTNGGMNDLRVISDEFQDGAPGYYSQEYFVLNDGPIKTADDLKNRVLATNGGGSAVDIAVRAMLIKHHIDPNRDVTWVQAPLPTLRPMLSAKKVDLFPGVLPFSKDPELLKIAHPLFTQFDALGRTQMLVWVAHKNFIDKNRTALIDFMEDTLRIEHWFLDPKNHDAVIVIATRLTKTPAQIWGWLFTKGDYYRNPNMLPDLHALQNNVDMTHDLGFAPKTFNVEAYSDLGIVKAAAARLK